MKISEMMEKLAEPLSAAVIDLRQKGGRSFPFISWYHLANELDERIGKGCWQWQVLSVSQIGNNLVLVGRLTIYGDDGSRSMEATGCKPVDLVDFGDPASNAEAMAFKRAAAKFGLGRELSSKTKLQQGIPGGKKEFKKSISRDEWSKRQSSGDRKSFSLNAIPPFSPDSPSSKW